MQNVLTAEVGDVLLNSTGTGTVGRSAVFDDVGQYIIDGHITLLRPKKSKCSPSWLNSVLTSNWGQKHLERFCYAGSTNQVELSASALRRTELPTPLFEHQSKIAEVLDTLDAAIRGTKAVVAKLRAMKQGLLHDLLTRGIDANGDLRPPQPEAPHLYQKTPLGWLPKEWDETTLGAIAEVDRGQFTHRPRNDPRFYGGEFPFIQTGDVAAAKGDFVTRYSQTLNERGVSVSREFPAGTIAITIAANIADTGILAFPMYFPDSVVGAVVHEGLNTRFVELWIRRAKRLLDARAPQSAQKNINLQDLRPLEVFLPHKEEQDAIGDSYEALFSKLNREQRLLDKLRLQKSGLMDDLLTGRVPVTPLL
ncbi:restriction endonuclease subunit S [Paracoccus sediminis]|nr:restriction endonuclease subunit S [Paracoccus sediminis]TBN46994.1 restriction endonuclease subunit S [Paracoccus sediminis]